MVSPPPRDKEKGDGGIGPPGGVRLPGLSHTVNLVLSGGVAEWSIASVLKTEEAQVSVGSNPTPSVFLRSRHETFRWDENAVRAADRSPQATNPTPSVSQRNRHETFRWDTTKHQKGRGLIDPDFLVGPAGPAGRCLPFESKRTPRPTQSWIKSPEASTSQRPSSRNNSTFTSIGKPGSSPISTTRARSPSVLELFTRKRSGES